MGDVERRRAINQVFMASEFSMGVTLNITRGLPDTDLKDKAVRAEYLRQRIDRLINA
jgi:hypothetical protein